MMVLADSAATFGRYGLALWRLSRNFENTGIRKDYSMADKIKATKAKAVAKAASGDDKLEVVATIAPDAFDAALGGMTEPERAKALALEARVREWAAGPDMKLSMGEDGLTVTYKHENPEAARILLMSDLGTCDPAFFAAVSRQIASIGAHGARVDDMNSNFLLSVVRAVKPRDELESLLAVQMGGITPQSLPLRRSAGHNRYVLAMKRERVLTDTVAKRVSMVLICSASLSCACRPDGLK